MRRASSLFAKGFMTRQPGLSDVLEGHKQRILQRIRGISDLGQMTEAFLEHLVKDSLVGLLTIHFDRMTRTPRTEEFDARELPPEQRFGSEPGRRYQRQVARIAIPFTGEAELLQYTPNHCNGNFPSGDVYGDKIEFDVVFWRPDGGGVAEQIQEQRRSLEFYAAAMNKQVKEFNASLPSIVTETFRAKIDELGRQYDVLDALGIPEEEAEPPAQPTTLPTPQPRKRGVYRVNIIQHIAAMYVQQLNQTNNNIGDVNNAIQSD
jgi:hypothetical protein